MPPTTTNLLTLARKLGQSLRPGAAGMVPDIEKMLKGSPELAALLSKAEGVIPRIPKEIQGVADIQDLLQEVAAGGAGQDVRKTMQAYINRLMQQSGVSRGAPQLPAETIGAEQAISEAMLPPTRRAGVSLPEAERIQAALKPYQQAIIEKVASGQPLTKSEAGQLARIRQQTGTNVVGRGHYRGAPSPGGPQEPPIPGFTEGKQTFGGPVKSVTEPEEVDKALAAYERLFEQPPPYEPISQPPDVTRPPRRPSGRAEDLERARGFHGKPPEEAPDEERAIRAAKKRFGPQRVRRKED